MMTGGPTAEFDAGLPGGVWLMPAARRLDASFEVAAQEQRRSAGEDGTVTLSVPKMAAKISVEIGWDEDSAVRYEPIEAWPGVGFRVGSYPGYLSPGLRRFRFSDTIAKGAGLYLPGLYDLRADVSWVAELEVNVAVPMENALQSWGTVEIPYRMRFSVVRIDLWRTPEGSPNQGYPEVLSRQDLPLGEFSVTFGQVTAVSRLSVPITRGWCRGYPGARMASAPMGH